MGARTPKSTRPKRPRALVAAAESGIALASSVVAFADPDGEPINGEDLLESPELKRQLREAKERERLRRKPVRK